MVGALLRGSNRLFGTLNARSLESFASFGPERSVSPKLLSVSQKLERWHEIWFPDVLLIPEPADPSDATKPNAITHP